jgi:UDPglucose--hexose-1-phosphate uridylyltransferase
VSDGRGTEGSGDAADRVDLRRDALTGALVVEARRRQDRPNLPADGCPFCPGGLEAPEPYLVRWFANRWPALPGGRCEVVLFSPDHSESLGSLGDEQMRRVISLWAERTEALGAREGIGYVLLFENRGAQVGATIPHPHGQVYAFERVPPAAEVELASGECAVCAELAGKGDAGPTHAERTVIAAGGWRAWTVWAASYPFELLVAPEEHLGTLAASEPSWDGLARVLQTALGALDRLFDGPMPYMMWCHQRPTDGREWPSAHVHFHVAPVNRAPGVARFVAAGELGSGIMFNPVEPEDAAARLRSAKSF